MESSNHNEDKGGLLEDRLPNVQQVYDDIELLDLRNKIKVAPVLGHDRELQGIDDAHWRLTGSVQDGKKGKKERKKVKFSSDRRIRRAAIETLAMTSQSVGKENVEVNTSLDQFARREEGPWPLENASGSKTEERPVDDSCLRDTVTNVKDENILPEDLANVTLQEALLMERLWEFQSQMDGHRKKMERAEKTILELRQSAAHSYEQARKAQADLKALQKVFQEKDGETKHLQNLVDRLKGLCIDHEKTIQSLQQGIKNGMDKNDQERSPSQREKHMQNGAEIQLRGEREAFTGETNLLQCENKIVSEKRRNGESDACLNKLHKELQAEFDQLQAKAAELKEENNLLTAKLRVLMREKVNMVEAIRNPEKGFALKLEEENKRLREELRRGRVNTLQARERQAHKQVKQGEGCCATGSHISRDVLRKERKKAAVAPGGTDKERGKEVQAETGKNMERGMGETMQVSTRQLHSMNRRVEMMSDRLLQYEAKLLQARVESERKDELICSLEKTISNFATTVDDCVLAENEELARLSQSQTRQIEDLHRKIAAAVESKHKAEREMNKMKEQREEWEQEMEARDSNRLSRSQTKQIEDLHKEIAAAVHSKEKAEREMKQVKEQLEEWEQEMEARNLSCQMLREKVIIMEAALEKCHPQVTSKLENDDGLVVDGKKLQFLLADASLRISQLEQQLGERKEAVRLLEIALEDLSDVVEKGREELNRVSRERNEMQQEAKAVGREALHLSLEVEMLRRRVRQLDEDILLRDGQISILRGGLEAE